MDNDQMYLVYVEVGGITSRLEDVQVLEVTGA